MGIHLPEIIDKKKLLTNSLKIFYFWKKSGYFSKNVWEQGFQVPDFLRVCNTSWWRGGLIVEYPNIQQISLHDVFIVCLLTLHWLTTWPSRSLIEFVILFTNNNFEPNITCFPSFCGWLIWWTESCIFVILFLQFSWLFVKLTQVALGKILHIRGGLVRLHGSWYNWFSKHVLFS